MRWLSLVLTVLKCAAGSHACSSLPRRRPGRDAHSSVAIDAIAVDVFDVKHYMAV
jgi:hypothetical protein